MGRDSRDRSRARPPRRRTPADVWRLAPSRRRREAGAVARPNPLTPGELTCGPAGASTRRHADIGSRSRARAAVRLPKPDGPQQPPTAVGGAATRRLRAEVRRIVPAGPARAAPEVRRRPSPPTIAAEHRR
eukprot:gene13061-biopygen12074